MTVSFRQATIKDLPEIVVLLADDVLSAERERVEQPLPVEYGTAFDAIEAQPGNEILVGERDGHVVACLQLTIIPGLSHCGMTRALIENVRVLSRLRGQGIGTQFLSFAEARARASGCRLVELTSSKSRLDAHRFYERLGYRQSHAGFKRSLS